MEMIAVVVDSLPLGVRMVYQRAFEWVIWAVGMLDVLAMRTE